MSSHREPMSSVDQAWLRMDRDDNLMMICSVLVLDKAPDRARLQQTIEHRLLSWPRFQQRVVREGGRAWWEDDPHFHLDNHIHSVGLGGEGDRHALEKLAGDLASTPLDARHPLWAMHVVEDYQGGAAVIMRMHHCIADGLALVRVLLSMTDDCAEGSPPPTLGHPSRIERAWHAAQHFGEGLAGAARQVVDQAGELVRHPSQLVELAEKGLAVGKELVDIGLQPKDPPSDLKGQRSGRKQVAWCDPLDLDEVKTLAHQLGGTVNDVLMTVAAGALRQWLIGHDQYCDESLHVAVPFNLRPLDKPIRQLGNQFGLVIVRMPVEQPEPLERYKAIQTHMRALKASPQPLVFYGMLALFGRGPEVMERMALDLLSNKASLVMTNVPGPKQALYMAGARIRQPLFWVPQSGVIGVGLSILSYDGGVQFGVISDEALLPHPAELAEAFTAGFAELQQAADGADAVASS